MLTEIYSNEKFILSQCFSVLAPLTLISGVWARTADIAFSLLAFSIHVIILCCIRISSVGNKVHCRIASADDLALYA